MRMAKMGEWDRAMAGKNEDERRERGKGGRKNGKVNSPFFSQPASSF